MKKSEKKLPSEGDLLIEKDVQKLISCANHPRNKAFISVLWESGARVGEIGNLCIKNVAFDQYGAVISVKGKTGSRKIRLISSTPYLSTWINSHPFQKDVSAPLWVNIGTVNRNKILKFQPKICPRCDTINAHDSKHCRKWGGIVDLKHAIELEQTRIMETKLRNNSDQLMNMLFKDEEVQALLMKKLQNLNPSCSAGFSL